MACKTLRSFFGNTANACSISRFESALTRLASRSTVGSVGSSMFTSHDSSRQSNRQNSRATLSQTPLTNAPKRSGRLTPRPSRRMTSTRIRVSCRMSSINSAERRRTRSFRNSRLPKYEAKWSPAPESPSVSRRTYSSLKDSNLKAGCARCRPLCYIKRHPRCEGDQEVINTGSNMFDATRAESPDSARQALPVRPVLRIFISSTAIDLTGYRDKVRDAVLRLENLPIAMETFSALGGAPASECRRTAAEADAVVCIVAHRYGYVPPVELGGDGERSITWLEVDAAKRAGKPVFAFLVDPKAPWTEVKEQDRLVSEPEIGRASCRERV